MRSRDLRSPTQHDDTRYPADESQRAEDRHGSRKKPWVIRLAGDARTVPSSSAAAKDERRVTDARSRSTRGHDWWPRILTSLAPSDGEHANGFLRVLRRSRTKSQSDGGLGNKALTRNERTRKSGLGLGCRTSRRHRRERPGLCGWCVTAGHACWPEVSHNNDSTDLGSRI